MSFSRGRPPTLSLQRISYRASRVMIWIATPHLLPERWARHKMRAAAAREERQRRLLLAGAGQPPAGGARSIAFIPDGNGVYRWSDRLAYCYVPPRPPDDLDARLQSLPQYFSVLVPAYNTPADLLHRMIASLQAQWYQKWELILADDASSSAQTRDYLAAIEDPRVKVLFAAENGGISAATNRALAQAQGDYVVFLDHDDELTEDCLYELAVAAARDDADFIYSDEDKIAFDGTFADPFYKPDWSPDTLMSTMYTCHVTCLRTGLLREIGGLRSEFDGAQDWDLALRATEKAGRITHVPKVLYHWRMIPQSTAADFGAKPYALDAGRRAREEALRRRGLDGEVEPLPEIPGHFRLRYDMSGTPLISIIIPSRDNGEILRRCVESIEDRSRYTNFEIILIDNGSTQPRTLKILDALTLDPQVRLIRHNAPFNYSEINNLGVSHARGNLLLFLNDDTEVLTEDWLERMAGYAQLPHVGAVGAKLLYPQTRRVQHSGVINISCGPSHAFLARSEQTPGYFVRNLLEYNWIAVTAACLMIERAKYEAVGGFDESLPVAYNDVEFCFRLIEAGLFNLTCQSAQLLHHESASRGNDLANPEKKARLDRDRHALYIRHPDFLMHDPFYNPHLHPQSVDFEPVW